jgi:nicotinamide-nucleotide amidase
MKPTREAAELVRALVEAGETLAVAESLTGGLVAATVTAVPGASNAFRGGVVAYATDLKVSLLGVPQELAETVGVVSAEAAEAMATGVRERCVSTWGISTTGVAGPDLQEGKPAGLVYLGWAGPDGSGASRLDLDGDRDTIRSSAGALALDLLARRLEVSRKDRHHRSG